MKNAEFKRAYDHGAEIAARIGHVAAAETFNPVIVDFYREVGYLPDAIVNYLMLLGWSLDDKTEDFSREEMIRGFTLERVTKSPASFDCKKLWSFQDRYMQRLPLKQKVAKMLPYLQKAGLISEPAPCEFGPKLTQIVEASGDRLKTAGDILAYADFFFVTDEKLAYNEKDFNKRIIENPYSAPVLQLAINRLSRLKVFTSRTIRDAIYSAARQVLKSHLKAVSRADVARLLYTIDVIEQISQFPDPFEPHSIEADLKEAATEQGIPISDLVHPIRIAISGKAVGPGLWDCIAILGKESTVARLKRAFSSVAHHTGSVLHRVPAPVETPPIAKTGPFLLPANQNVVLFEGRITASPKGSSSPYDGPGTVQLEWLPRPSIRLNWNDQGSPDFDATSYRFEIPSHNIVSEGFITSIGHSSGKPGAQVEAVVSERIQRTTHSKIKRAEFYIANLSDLRGNPVGSAEGSAWTGRFSVETDKFEIVFDSRKDLRDQLTVAKRSAGFVMSHVGEIAAKDRESYSSEMFEEALTGLQYFLTFISGRWVAPIIVTGFTDDNRLEWEDWSVRLLEPFRNFETWIPRSDKDWMPIAFSRFYASWHDLHRRSLLQDAIYWYVQSFLAGSVELKTIAVSIALRHASAIVFPGTGAIPSQVDTHIDIAAIRTAIGKCEIDVNTFEAAKNLCETLGVTDLAELALRLSTLAQSPISAGTPFGGKDLGDLLYEGWDICQWLLDLLLLRIIGYDGRYHNRLDLRRYAWSAEKVPWARSSSD